MAKSTVGDMTKEELRAMLGELIDQKFAELLEDPDASLVLRKPVRDKLERQQRATAKGERGRSVEDVKNRLGVA